MSKTDLAKHCGELALGAAILCLGVTEGATVGAIAAINLASVWQSMRSGSVPAAQRAAVAATLDALERNREFHDDAIKTASALLARPPAAAAFTVDETVALMAANRFIEEGAQRLTAMLKAGDAQVDAVLNFAFTAALTACVATKDFRAGIQWDLDRETLRTVHRIESLFGEALRRLQETSDLADGQIIQMAKRLSPEVRTREEALAALDQVVEAAQRIALRGRTPSNHPDFLDQVFTEVARLNAQSREDEGVAALEAALVENAAQNARLLEGLRDQHILRQDATALAEVIERLLMLEGLTGMDLYLAMRGNGRGMEENSKRLGTPFDLRAAVAFTYRCEVLAPDAERRGWSLNDRGTALQLLGERGDDQAVRNAVEAQGCASDQNTPSYARLLG